MAHISTENLLKVLDRLPERPSWKVAMRSIGASEALAFVWRAQSVKAQNENDTSSPFFVEWRNSWDFWHSHAGRARSESIITYEALIRDQAMNGIEEPVLGPDQKPIYKESERYIGRDDDFIRISEGLDANASVAWYRLERDAKGNPVPLMKRTQLPAPLRLRVLQQDRRYIEQKNLDVSVSGVVTAEPPKRLPSEPRPDVEKLRALAALSPEERRAKLGAVPFPKNQQGMVIPVNKGDAKGGDNRSDHVREQQPIAPPVNPRAYEAPVNEVKRGPQPSYARPVWIDGGEGIGPGTPPEGGVKVR